MDQKNRKLINRTETKSHDEAALLFLKIAALLNKPQLNNAEIINDASYVEIIDSLN